MERTLVMPPRMISLPTPGHGIVFLFLASSKVDIMYVRSIVEKDENGNKSRVKGMPQSCQVPIVMSASSLLYVCPRDT